MVDRYLRLIECKTISGSAEIRLESFYPPLALLHQGVMDSYDLQYIHNEDVVVLNWAIDMYSVPFSIFVGINAEYWSTTMAGTY